MSRRSPTTKGGLRLDPGNPDAHARLGDIRRALEQYDSALASYTEVLSLRPDDYAALTGRPADQRH